MKSKMVAVKLIKTSLTKIPCALAHAKRKRCYDVMLSRQEGSTTSTTDRPAGGDTGRPFLTFGGPVCADRISYCPLDRMY